MATVKGFIFDYSKCVGCHACLVGCSVENDTKPPLSWRAIKTYNKQKLPLLGFVNLSIACNHCQEAPCLNACPSSAFHFDSQTRAVIHNPDACLGCKYCTWVCPFDAPKFNEHTGTVEKCHFCYHRLKENQIPACAQACPTGALSFGDIDVEPNPRAFGLSERSIYPRIKILQSDVKDSIPKMDMESSLPASLSSENNIIKPFSRKNYDWLKEWPLAIFTFICALLVGWVWASLNTNSVYLSPWILAGFSAVAMLASTAHLGKPFRAYKSINNLKTSWLSREILMFGLFVSTAFFSNFLEITLLKYIACGFGALLLFSIEKLYLAVGSGYQKMLNSGNTIFIAIIFSLLFANQMDILSGLLALQTMLFIVKTAHVNQNFSLALGLVAFLRLIFGFIVPFGIIVMGNGRFYFALVASIVIGQIIDRLMFYYEFKPERPFDRVESSLSIKS